MVAQATGGWSTLKRLIAPVLVMGLGMGLAQLLVALAGTWNLAAFAGGVVGLVIGFPMARLHPGVRQLDGRLDGRRLLVALSGYAVLIAITLIVQLVQPVQEFLGQVVIRLDFPEVVTARGYITPAGSGRVIRLFSHPGATLVYSSLLAYFIYRAAGLYRPEAARRILGGTLSRVMSSSVSIASMVSMAVIMENAGMTDALARGLAGEVGAVFPAVAPWIGAIGAFMTGSNTNSNVVFGALQMRTAELLGYSTAIILAGQTAGAGLASVIAPTKIVVGASTAGMAGQEGMVMRRMLVYIGLLIGLISVLTLLGIGLE
jgi:lactate permease